MAVGFEESGRCPPVLCTFIGALCVASAILVKSCRQPTTKRFREVAVESSKYSMHHRLRRAPTTAHCPRCAGPASRSVRVTGEAHQVGSLISQVKEGREVDAARPPHVHSMSGLMCTPSPVNGGQCCRYRMVGAGGLSCMWRVGHWEPRVSVGGIQDPRRH